MSNPGDLFPIPATYYIPSMPPVEYNRQDPVGSLTPLQNLSTVRFRMDSLHDFLAQSLNSNSLIGQDQMDMVSTEISSAIHQIIVNGAALLTCSQYTNPNQSRTVHPSPIVPEPVDDSNGFDSVDLKIEDVEVKEETPIDDDLEIIELGSVELLAEHIHFCDICGKGFKRDANLRMHMRAHGNQFKTAEALAKPERNPPESLPRKTRFSCPFVGCGRNKSHKKFKPLKSAICVKNHFKRSHCPKMYSCDRCNKKSFSVVADLKSHLKNCGESKWKCSCGTTFSRKDKLFGHVALFVGHMPVVEEDGESSKIATPATMVDVEEKDENRVFSSSVDSGFFDGLMDDFGSIANYCLQDVLESPDRANENNYL